MGNIENSFSIITIKKNRTERKDNQKFILQIVGNYNTYFR